MCLRELSDSRPAAASPTVCESMAKADEQARAKGQGQGDHRSRFYA